MRCFGVRPEIVLALQVAHNIFEAFSFDLVVTSLLDGEHSRSSLHYTGCAADLRLPGSRAAEVVAALQHALGDDFDVILESDHIHIEFQPKASY